ncbi:hypothetical protein ABTM57_19655, partial [Acinetobacter baumannii]
ADNIADHQFVAAACSRSIIAPSLVIQYVAAAADAKYNSISAPHGFRNTPFAVPSTQRAATKSVVANTTSEPPDSNWAQNAIAEGRCMHGSI